MFNRILKLPDKSFFLLGPRGTGKTSLLRNKHFDLRIDLLSTKDLLTFSSNPARLYEQAQHLKNGSWILIDEVQKVPMLLDEVHRLYEEKKINFALSGSSARKLKRVGTNLLAGRAINIDIFPLCYAEYKDKLDLEARLNWGTLPLIVDNQNYLAETALAYVHNYLRQEIAEEGLVRKLENFARFLPVSAIYNGKIINYKLVSEYCQIERNSVKNYFEILFDTLVAYKLPAWRPKLKVKEVSTPKFYFFDPGIARACFGLNNEVDHSYRGFLLENLIINEVHSYNSYYAKRKDLHYYAISNSFEVDLVIDLGRKQNRDQVILLEIKLAKHWDPRWNSGMLAVKENESLDVVRSIGIYTGEQRYSSNGIEIMPVDIFLDEMFKGNIF